MQNKSNRKQILRYLFSVGLISVLMTTLFFKIVYNTSVSMNPTIPPGTYLLGIKSNPWTNFRSGDIVVAEVGVEIPVLKRIIGVQGDLIEVVDSNIYHNGRLTFTGIGPNNEEQKFLIGNDQYFLMGDFVKDSYDSRNYGLVNKAQISVKILFPLWMKQSDNPQGSSDYLPGD